MTCRVPYAAFSKKSADYRLTLGAGRDRMTLLKIAVTETAAAFWSAGREGRVFWCERSARAAAWLTTPERSGMPFPRGATGTGGARYSAGNE